MKIVKEESVNTECKHIEFASECFVFRLRADNESTEIIAHAADIKIKCLHCGMPMEFIGLPIGLSAIHPTTDIDCTTLRVPIRPSSAPPIKNENLIIN